MSPITNPELVTTFRFHGSHDFSAGAQLDAMGHPGLGHIDVSGGGPKNQFGKWAVLRESKYTHQEQPKVAHDPGRPQMGPNAATGSKL
jgi:hypothetical protein